TAWPITTAAAASPAASPMPGTMPRIASTPNVCWVPGMRNRVSSRSATRRTCAYRGSWTSSPVDLGGGGGGGGGAGSVTRRLFEDVAMLRPQDVPVVVHTHALGGQQGGLGRGVRAVEPAVARDHPPPRQPRHPPQHVGD